MNKHLFKGSLPDDFFSVDKSVYPQKQAGFSWERKKVLDLMQARQSKDDSILFYDENVRLAGIFPRTGTTAYFGFWEGLNHLDPHQEAFHQLEMEAIKRGFNEIIGPMDFNTFHPYRIRLQTPQAWTSFLGEPDNPEYYASMLGQCGFEISQKFNSHYISPVSVAKIYERQTFYLESLKDIPFEKVALNADFWEANLPEIFGLIQNIFSANPNFQPISLDEFCIDYGTEFGKMLCPHTSVLFKEKSSGEWAAISMCFPNYHELEGISGPYSFETHYPLLKRKTFLAKTIGVHPKYRNQHLMRYLAAYGMVHLSEYYEDAIFCLMREDNISNSFTARFEKEVVNYAIYRKELRPES